MRRKKEKKLSIKHVLHDKVNPVINEKGEEEYPLYIQVGFNRQLTRFPINFYSTYTWKEFERSYANKEVANQNLIESAIRFEVSVVGIEKFTLTGLANRLDLYFEPLGDVLEDFLINQFDELAKDVLSYRSYVQMTEIYPDESLHDLKTIEWFPLDERIEFAQKNSCSDKKVITPQFEKNQKLIYEYLKFQDEIIFKMKESRLAGCTFRWFDGYIKKQFTKTKFSIELQEFEENINQIVREIVKQQFER